MLTALDGDDWKSVRAILTTGFTTGKLKSMTGLMLDTCESFTNHLDKLIEKDETMNAKEMFSCFATDIICSNFFGINVDTLSEPDHPLIKNISKVFGAEFMKNWRILLIFLFPKFTSFLLEKNIMSVVDSESIGYISQLSEQIIEERRSKAKFRNDFVQHMVDHLENEEKDDDDKTEEATVDENNENWKKLRKKLTNGEILSQSILFMLAGSDTTAVTLSWLAYNLAFYSECQDKLIEEVDSVLEENDGKVTYESINQMKYMSLCISETQRMYTVAQSDREANSDFEHNGIKLKKGQHVVTLLYTMSHDESVFPEADKFKPERERPGENFLPFGSGPRNCIAQRFALIEIKLLMATILSRYRFEKCEKTIANIPIDSSGLSKPKTPIYLKVVKR